MTNEDKDNKKNKFIQTFKLICEVGTKKLNLPRASIWLLDSFKNELNCIVYCNNKSKTVEEDLTVEITSDFLKSISNSRLISIKNTSEETTVKKLYEAYFKPLGIKSVLISSIIISGKTLGLLFFEETKPGRAWEEKEKNLALDLANQLASKMTEKNHISYQNKLNISENKYRTIFENVNDVIFILDKLTIIDCNSKAVDCFGISRDKLLNKKITFLFPDKQDDGKTSAEEFEKILEEKQTEKDHFFEWKFKDSQGRVIITEVSLSVISMGKHDYITLIVRDITRRRKNEEELEKHRSKLEKLVRERTRSLQKTNKQLEEEIIKHRKTEEALRTSDRRITMAFEAANEGIWDWDLEKDEFYLSPRFYELLGYKTEEFHADKDSLVKLAHNDDREKFELNLECFKTNEQEYNKFSIRMKYKDGEYRW
ncbi:MAG: PAS domain-containing protein, partial [Vulcanimicrobiota bacterium]